MTKMYVLAQFFVAPIFRKQNKFILYVCMYVCIFYVLDSSWEIRVFFSQVEKIESFFVSL
jgi:hypothetical protein